MNEIPDWLAEINIGQIITFWGGAVIIIGGFIRFWKPVRKVFKGLDGIVGDWNGTPERLDASGEVIEPAVPGVVAQINILRRQVENSHQNAENPNLRDDLDTKASKTDVARLETAVGEVAAAVAEALRKHDEHITIAKESDRRQETTAATLTKYLPHLRQLAGEE